MKGQDTIPGKQLKEVEIGNLPEKEFRIMIVKMVRNLGKRMEAKIGKMQEMFTKELKNKQTEMNNTLEGINNNNWGRRQIYDLEDRMVEISVPEQRMKRNEDRLRDLWNIKCTNICIIRVPEGQERKDMRKYLKR